MTWYRKLPGMVWFDLSEAGAVVAVNKAVDDFLAHHPL